MFNYYKYIGYFINKKIIAENFHFKYFNFAPRGIEIWYV